MKTLFSIMFFTLISGCSFIYRSNSLSKEQSNKYNREIISNFSKAILKDPYNPLFYLERGMAKHDYGDYIGAINDFNISLGFKKDKKVIFNRANSKYAYGDHKGAIKDYKELILKRYFQDQVFYNIASSQLIILKYVNAIDNYTKSISFDQDENAFLNRGNAKFNISDYLGSIKDYEKSLDINKQSYIAFNNMGVSKFKLKDYSSALKDFKKSLKLNSKNYNTLYNKSITHFELKEFKKACIDLKKSIKLGKEIFKDEYEKICLRNLKY